jgi:hypothetical protein
MSALPAERTPVIVYTDAPGSLYDSILVAGRVQDMTGATVLFYVRPLQSRVPLLNGVTGVPIVPPDNSGNNIRYDFQPSDITTLGGEGDFMAWWKFTLPSLAPQETPEFPLLLSDHGPGTGTQTGAVVAGATAFMPITLDNLRRDERYGDKWLQQQAEVIKLRVLGTSITPDTEDTIETVLLDYLSKRLALQLIPAGIEYWSRQMRTATSTATSEVTSYPDMIASLKELGSRLCCELEQQWRDLLVLQPGLAVRTVIPMPASTLGDPNQPWISGYNTRSPRVTDILKTGGWGWDMDFSGWPFP